MKTLAQNPISAPSFMHHQLHVRLRSLSLTPRFSGVVRRLECVNRFSGFLPCAKTAEAVGAGSFPRATPLKRGVNERTITLPLVLLLPLGFLHCSAQAPLSNLVVTLGATTTDASPYWSYVLLDTPQPQLLAGKQFGVYSKPGYPSDTGTYTLRGTNFQRTDLGEIDNLLNQSVALHEDLTSLSNTFNVLLHNVPGISNMTLPQKIIAGFQTAAANPFTHQIMELLPRTHPGLALCSGRAFSEPITLITTYEIRELSLASGAAEEVVGRVTIKPGMVDPLPAPGFPVPVVKYNPYWPIIIHDSADNLIIRMRWGTGPELRRRSLLGFGYNVWRTPSSYALSQGWNVNPPSSAEALRFDTNVTNVNHAPVMAPIDYPPDSFDGQFTDTTSFIADSHGRAYGNPQFTNIAQITPGYLVPPFNDGDRFYYFITARDLLGRDGYVSHGTEAIACRRVLPPAPAGVKVVNTTTTNGAFLQVNWLRNTNTTNAVTEYWVYRWADPAMALTNDSAPYSNRIAVVSQVDTNSYLDRGPDAPTKAGPTNFWYTVRAVSQNACGEFLLSPHSPPAWGVLRERTGPTNTTGSIIGSCGIPAVMFNGMNTLAVPPDPAHWNYRLTCQRRDRGIAWVQFAVSNAVTFGTNQILGPLYFAPDGDSAYYDYPLPVADTNYPDNYQMNVSCVVGTYYGEMSQPANWTAANLLTATQRQEVVFLAGDLLLTSLSSSDPLLAAVTGQYCEPALNVTPYPEGTVRMQFNGGVTLDFFGPRLIQVSSNGVWVDVGVATADTNHFYWLNYPACAVGPVPAFRGCRLNLPADCSDFVAGASDPGPVAPILVRFLLQPRTREYRLYRCVNDSPLGLISQGAASYDINNPQRAIVCTDDAIPPSDADLCYSVQLLDENGNGGPLSFLGYRHIRRATPPRPLLAEPKVAGTADNPQVTLTWACPPAGVYRFHVLIEKADEPGHTNTGFALSQVARAASYNPNSHYQGLTGTRAAVHFDESQLTPPVSDPSFGPGPKFTLTASLVPKVTYNLSVAVADATGRTIGPPSMVRKFTWIPGPVPISVPWPHRPPPPVLDFDDGGLFAPVGTGYPYPRVAAVLQYLDRTTTLDQQYPVGIRIGDLYVPNILDGILNNIGTSNFLSYRLPPGTNSAPYTDPNDLVFRISSHDPNRNGGSLLPIVVYRQQVTNAAFPHVSGTLTQVTPLVERIPYELYSYQSFSIVFVDDLLVAGGTERTSLREFHPFLYLRDQQPVVRGAAYQYYAVRFNDQREVSEIIPAGTVTIPANP